MHVRVSRLRAAPGRIEALIGEFTGEVAPKLRAIPGNTGAVLLVDRQKGTALGITYWRDKAALDGSETAANGLRTATATKAGATVEDVQRGEILLMERNGPPQAGSHVRSIQFSVAPGQVDAGVAYMRSTVLPELKHTGGFRAVIVGANRETSQGFVSTVWESRAALDASDASLGTLRQEALQRFGAGNVNIDVLESVYVDITATALT